MKFFETMATNQNNGATEVFTLIEGTVTITYPAKISGESIGDIGEYFKLFVAKLARQGEDPHDPMSP